MVLPWAHAKLSEIRSSMVQQPANQKHSKQAADVNTTYQQQSAYIGMYYHIITCGKWYLIQLPFALSANQTLATSFVS